VADEARIVVAADTDIVEARRTGRDLAAHLGFSLTDLTMIATAISEMARNITTYAGHGEIILRVIRQAGRHGLMVIAHDDGPGIADLDRAMEDGYTTGRGLGLGLPGSRRLMDEFEIDSRPGRGTTVIMRKWTSVP
jgi:serine/threonine-protein kinase RsbT